MCADWLGLETLGVGVGQKRQRVQGPRDLPVDRLNPMELPLGPSTSSGQTDNDTARTRGAQVVVERREKGHGKGAADPSPARPSGARRCTRCGE